MSADRLTRRDLAGAIAETRRRLDDPRGDASHLCELLNGARPLGAPKDVPYSVYDDIRTALDLIEGARRALGRAAATVRSGKRRST